MSKWDSLAEGKNGFILPSLAKRMAHASSPISVQEEVDERTSNTHVLIDATGLVKHYGSVVALDGADFACCAGEVHAVLGENGAGKSTLVKVLGGTVLPDAGTVRICGEPIRLGDPRVATTHGIAAVYQELSVIPDLTVAENIFLLREPLHRLRIINQRLLYQQTEALFADLGITGISPYQRVGRLSLAQKQIVEIAKAAARNGKIIILDEPTSALAEKEVEWLLGLMKRWRAENRSIIFISHRYNEIKAIADRLSIYRGGRRVAIYRQGEVEDSEVITAMSGRSIEVLFPPRPPLAADSPTILSVRDLSSGSSVHNLTFTARRGEIMGIGGLAGQGQLEVFLSLFGALSYKGQVTVRGHHVKLRSPQDAVKVGIGIALVPAERKTEGLLLTRSLRENMSLPALDRLSGWGVIDRKQEYDRVHEMIHALNIVAHNIDMPVNQLSGGNQQKVVIGKWLLSGATILLLYDVTRGVDVGTKAQIYKLIVDAALQGATILFYSTDTQEMVHLCHRVLVMYEGRLVRVLEGDEIDERQIVSASIGHGSSTIV